MIVVQSALTYLFSHVIFIITRHVTYFLEFWDPLYISVYYKFLVVTLHQSLAQH